MRGVVCGGIRLNGEETVNGRDKKGRFTNGNGGGPGRPSKKREERYYEIAMSSCTYKDWRAIWKKAVEQAVEGDATARKFVADYLLGPPVQRQEITGADGADLAIRVIGGINLSDDV